MRFRNAIALDDTRRAGENVECPRQIRAMKHSTNREGGRRPPSLEQLAWMRELQNLCGSAAFATEQPDPHQAGAAQKHGNGPGFRNS
jgi:hypothetical protein